MGQVAGSRVDPLWTAEASQAGAVGKMYSVGAAREKTVKDHGLEFLGYTTGQLVVVRQLKLLQAGELAPRRRQGPRQLIV